MDLKIAVLPGDGVGPEVTAQAVKVLKAVATKYKHNFTFSEALAGGAAIEANGEPLPDASLQLCKESDAILLGAIGDPKYENSAESQVWPGEGLLRLRKELGLFANIRPLKTYQPLIHKSPLKEKVIKNTDFVIYRELSGGIYFGEKKGGVESGEAMDTCTYNTEQVDRIAEMAFKAAAARKKKLTLVDKANVLYTSRLWRARVKQLAKDYPDVEVNYLYADNAAMKIILNPREFDVILTENLFGDILSDEASVISGSIGLLSSSSIGEKSALFEPIHGSMQEQKGKNIANPLATILSAALLLDHFGLNEEADAVRTAAEKSIELNITTPDINSTKKFAHTSTVGDFIAEYIIDKKNVMYNVENISLGQSTII